MGFTPITAALDWQDLAFLNELQTALSERVQALGGSPLAALVAGQDVQDAAFWTLFQQWLQDYCTAFADHTQYDPSIGFSGLSALPMFTLSAWRSAAGLHEDGFRRATEWPADWTNPADPAYSHGLMEAGDIIGPWCFQDLQRGFSALRWTVGVTRGSQKREAAAEPSYWDSWAWDATVDACRTVWTASDWDTLAGSRPVYGVYAAGFYYEWDGFYWHYRATVGRERSTPTIEGLAACCPHAAEIYLLPGTIPTREYAQLWPDSSEAGWPAFADVDGIGLVEGQLFRWQQIDSATAETTSGTPVGDSSDFPFDLCTVPEPGEYQMTGQGVSVARYDWLLKWLFSDQ